MWQMELDSSILYQLACLVCAKVRWPSIVDGTLVRRNKLRSDVLGHEAIRMLNADIPAEREPAASHAEPWFTRQMVVHQCFPAGGRRRRIR